MESTRGGRSGSNSGTLIAIFLIVVLVAATMVAYFTVMQFPDQVTEEADDINSLYAITLALATFVFLSVEALIIWVVFRFRRRSNTDPAQVHGNNRLEFGWTAIPVMIMVVLFTLSAPLVIDLRDSEAEAADLTVNVTGRQWFWEYEYPEEGITIQEIPDYENPDPPALVVPVDQLVVLNVTSGDVVHSFYVPDFLYKIQAIPGQVNEMHFTAEEIGTYTGQCAQFCGLNHAQMLLKVEVVSQEDYDAWVEEQLAAQEETPTPGPEPTGTPGADGEADDDADGGTVLEITATDNEFDTDELTAPAGEITVELTNEGAALHNFAIPDEDVASDLIPGGETTSVTFTLSEPGEYDYQCDVHPTQMQGTLIVE
jgi:cytochrome c oxidase subunit 2